MGPDISQVEEEFQGMVRGAFCGGVISSLSGDLDEGIESVGHKPPVEQAFEFPCGCRKWVGRFLACMEHEGKVLLVPAYPTRGDGVRELNLKEFKERRRETIPSISSPRDDFNFGPSTLDGIYDEEWRDVIPPPR
jgi:hypothetical protein